MIVLTYVYALRRKPGDIVFLYLSISPYYYFYLVSLISLSSPPKMDIPLLHLYSSSTTETPCPLYLHTPCILFLLISSYICILNLYHIEADTPPGLIRQGRYSTNNQFYQNNTHRIMIHPTKTETSRKVFSIWPEKFRQPVQTFCLGIYVENTNKFLWTGLECI